MDRKYNVFLVSDSTGETLDRIFLALKAQFENFNNNLHHFSFVRTEAQIATLLEKCNKLGKPNSALYSCRACGYCFFNTKKQKNIKFLALGFWII
jgi:hypothetical protein